MFIDNIQNSVIINERGNKMKKIRIRLEDFYDNAEYDLIVTEEQIKILDWLITKGIIDGQYERLDEIQPTDLTT